MVLVLAIICAGEAGLHPSPDCPAIYQVLTDRSERLGVPWERAARWYSSGYFNRRRTDPRAWLPWLRADGRRPRHWPERASWARQRAGWMALLEQAGRIVRGEEVAPCAAEHWGDHFHDRERAERAGWRRLDCGDTRNMFWSVPRGTS